MHTFSTVPQAYLSCPQFVEGARACLQWWIRTYAKVIVGNEAARLPYLTAFYQDLGLSSQGSIFL